MADKIKPHSQDSDGGIYTELLSAKQAYEDGAYDNLIGAELPNIPRDGLPDAKSKWATGRDCPKCKGVLKIQEIAESERGCLLVYCKSCGSKYWTDDLEDTQAVSDTIHRQIPDSMVLRYMEDLERRNTKLGLK